MLNMNFYSPNWDFNINGVSSIDDPVDNTLIRIRKEDVGKFHNLEGHQYCVLVADEGIVPSNKKFVTYNFLINSKDADAEYKSLTEKGNF